MRSAAPLAPQAPPICLRQRRLAPATCVATLHLCRKLGDPAPIYGTCMLNIPRTQGDPCGQDHSGASRAFMSLIHPLSLLHPCLTRCTETISEEYRISALQRLWFGENGSPVTGPASTVVSADRPSPDQWQKSEPFGPVAGWSMLQMWMSRMKQSSCLRLHKEMRLRSRAQVAQRARSETRAARRVPRALRRPRSDARRRRPPQRKKIIEVVVFTRYEEAPRSKQAACTQFTHTQMHGKAAMMRPHHQNGRAPGGCGGGMRLLS